MKDAVKAGILDLYLVKHWAIKFATDAAVTMLRVDQVRELLKFVGYRFNKILVFKRQYMQLSLSWFSKTLYSILH